MNDMLNSMLNPMLKTKSRRDTIMKKSFKLLRDTFQEEGLGFKIKHANNALAEVTYKGNVIVFTLSATPFNDHAMYIVCRDKEYFYNLYKDVVRMPATKGFLNPDCSEENKCYLEFSTVNAIVHYIEENFKFPLILKRNRGSHGDCVFKLDSIDEVPEKLRLIYERDYVAIAQEFVDIKEEFRVIMFENNLMFAYKKNNENAVFDGNLSPLHQHGAFAELIEDEDLLNRFEKFGRQISDKKALDYIGLDIVLDAEGEMHLIEANLAPGFSYLLENEKAEPLVKKLYQKMAARIKQEFSISK